MIKQRVNTKQRIELIDITRLIEDTLQQHDIQSGVLTLYVPHTTAGITINESADPDVKADIVQFLNKLVPHQDNYRHGEGNSDAHIKTSLIGSSVTVVREGGRLQLGRWQGIFFCEFDGPRTREVWGWASPLL